MVVEAMGKKMVKENEVRDTKLSLRMIKRRKRRRGRVNYREEEKEEGRKKKRSTH